MTEETKIRWTKVDEAPALATYSLLPIINQYLKGSGIEVETKDISLPGRVRVPFSVDAAVTSECKNPYVSPRSGWSLASM